MTAFAEACRSLQSSATVPSRHLPVKPGKFTNRPAVAWLGISSGSKIVSQMGIVQIKKIHGENNENRHLNGKRRERFIFADFQLVLRLLERHPVNV